ncbi:PEP-CTERM sorting domain-containing protein [Adhaeretor mobilis]|uniref:Putative lipoprotein n=1 Tax=Adhaeretor mobilis TaxID=1930276 RepID=A0A517MSV5_9BACT|nr:PEP-CTERM sorting domain-containing protein [Adhaeretor mobilis]QDS97963.1 putative lipoprotein [Adhaeretor mobilis]
MNAAIAKTCCRCFTSLFAILAVVLLAGTAQAATFTWDGQLSNSWGGSRNVGSVIVPKINSNWEPDGYSSLLLPTSSDPVVFGEYNAYNRTVNLNGNRSAKSLEFKNAQYFRLTNGTLSLASGNLTSTSTFTQTLDADITLGSSGIWDVSWAPVIVNGRISGSTNLTKRGVGPLYLTNDDNLLHNTYINQGSFKIQDGGSLTNSEAYIGDLPGTLGTAYVTGADSTWTSTDGLHVGSRGRGTLGITNAGTVTSTYGRIGELADSNGTVTVHGLNSTWNSGGLSIGHYGHGILNIQGGGSVVNSGTGIGSAEGSTGTVTVTDAGSTWNTGEMSIGVYGKGTLNIQNGAAVQTDSWVDIGVFGTSTNIATITGTNSTWDIASHLRVGYSTSGKLNIENGGTVTSNQGKLGELEVDYGSSIVTVTGANSAWHNNDTLNVGLYSDVGDVSTYEATLNIETGGTVSAVNAVRLRNAGSINLLGGTLRTANFEFFPDKVMNFDAGKLHLTQSTAINSSNIFALDVRNLTPGKTLRVDGITTLQTPLTLNGGKFSTDSIAGFNNFDFQSGTLELTHGNLIIGSAGLLGPNVSLPSGEHIAVTKNASIASNGVLSLSGGSFSAAKLTNNGTILTSGNIVNLFSNEVVHNGSEIRTPAGAGTAFGGSYSGSGDFTGQGDVYFGADVRLGDSPSTVMFQGNVYLAPSSTLTLKLDGLLSEEFDRVMIAGDASLESNLEIDWLESFILSPNLEFEILDIAGTLNGQFFGLGEGDLVGTFGGEDLFISYNAGDGNDVALFTSGTPGNFDSDDDVDGDDFLTLQRRFGQQGFGSSNHGNDLAAWNANYGTTTTPSFALATQAVPEPSTGILLVLGMVGLAAERRMSTRKLHGV